MIDYAEWVRQAGAFTTGLEVRLGGEVELEMAVEPALSEDGVARVETALSLPLPLALRAFLLSGSRACACRYVWTPSEDRLPQMRSVFPHQGWIYGGANFCGAADLPELVQRCRQWAKIFEEAPDQEAFWRDTLPFAWIRNGDMLALDVRHSSDDPPVVYLAHDDDSCVIAPTFTGFLLSWERLCYIGPEIWLLEEFLDLTSGLLDASSEKAQRLRLLFGEAQQLRLLFGGE